MSALKKMLLAVVILAGFNLSQACAESHTFSTDIRFIAPITLAGSSNPSLGRLSAGASSRNFALGTDGSISGANAAAYAGGAQAGSLKIQGSAFQNINIVAQNIVDDRGVHITSVTCNYGGNGNVDCGTEISAAAAPTSTGVILLLGLDVSTTTVHADGDSASPTFDIIVTYN